MFNTRQSPCRSLTTCHRYQRCPRLVGASRCNSKQYPIYWLVMKASFRIYSIQKQTRVSSISNRRLSVPRTAYISTVSYLAGFIQGATPPWYSVQLLLSHGRLPFFSGSVQCSQPSSVPLHRCGCRRPPSSAMRLRHLPHCRVPGMGAGFYVVWPVANFTTTSKLVSCLILNTEARAPWTSIAHSSLLIFRKYVCASAGPCVGVNWCQSIISLTCHFSVQLRLLGRRSTAVVRRI